MKISTIMWVFEAVCVICARSPFLHSLNVPIKMFTNSLAVLNQQTLRTTDHTHCFFFLSLLSNIVDGKLSGWLVLGRQETCLLFFSLWNKVWIARLGSGLMVNGIDLTFTLHSCTLVHERLFEVHEMWGARSCTQTCY